MCKHILNAQVSIRAACCKRWFECPECHEEQEDHPWKTAQSMAFACKVCHKAFWKDMRIFSDEDEVCPHCGNPYVLPAVTPESTTMTEAQQYINEFCATLLTRKPSPEDGTT